MPTVNSGITIRADIDRVYSLARDVERFPEFMPDVESVKIVEDDGAGHTVSEWVGKIKQFNRTLKWTEEDYWNDSEKLCTFTQLKGDFTEYGGVWKFESTNDGQETQALLTIDYSFDVPLIGSLIKGVLQKLVQQNCDNMLQSLKQHAESG